MIYNAHATSADVAYRELKRRILTKEFDPGQRLAEIGIAEQLGLSRTPVREALRRLGGEGLVLLVPNSGAWVAAPTKKEMEETYEVRQHLECLAIHRAARRITPAQLCLMEEQIDEEEHIFPLHDVERYIEVNTAFHMIIAEASDNGVLAEMVRQMLARSFAYMALCEDFFALEGNPSLDEHRQLVAALRERNAARAMRLMRRHVRPTEAMPPGRNAKSDAR